MPNKTYYNLKPDRQRQILEVAYREFILNDYQSASLSRIIKELELAKGSFYRYFSSKKDLYFFLLETSTSQRYDTLETRLVEPGMTLSRLLRINWQDKLEFDREHPLESAFQYRAFRERNNEETGDLEIKFKTELSKKIKYIINNYFPDSVRTDIELEMIVLLIIQTQLAMYDYLAIHFNDDLLKNIKEGRPLFASHKKEFEKVIDSFLKLLEKGISKK